MEFIAASALDFWDGLCLIRCCWPFLDDEVTSLRLSDFTALIADMPTHLQSFTSKRETKNWGSILNRQDRAGDAMRHIFEGQDSVDVSRGELREFARQESLDCFVMATLLWGYPDGMRGKNAANISASFDALVDLLGIARNGITNWAGHFPHVDEIRGVGLSTYTKFLCFLSVDVVGHTALILDQRIIVVAARRIFEEFQGNFSSRTYPDYLQLMHGIAHDLEVPAENLEFFLYEFGLNLKELPRHQ